MTTPNIQDLPCVIAEDGDAATLRIDTSNFPDKGSHFIWGSKGGIFVDPADLIRELSRFVPIPAEARKVITAWLARPVSTQQTVPERADHLLATLAAAGLLVGPGEPAVGEVERLREKVAFLDAALRRAEPATAPSVERIAAPLLQVYGGMRGTAFRVAEEIRALWSPAPGDADAESDVDRSRRIARDSRLNGRTIRQWMEAGTALQERAEKAEAERDEARDALVALSAHIHDRAAIAMDDSTDAEAVDSMAGRIAVLQRQYDGSRTENQRLRAALEAAKAESARQERRADEWKTQRRFVLEGAMQEAEERIELDLVMKDIQGDTARAAVEADTEGARDE